jgi:hypothetical protein
MVLVYVGVAVLVKVGVAVLVYVGVAVLVKVGVGVLVYVGVGVGLKPFNSIPNCIHAVEVLTVLVIVWAPVLACTLSNRRRMPTVPLPGETLYR